MPLRVERLVAKAAELNDVEQRMNVTFARKVKASSHVAVGRLNPARVPVIGISEKKGHD